MKYRSVYHSWIFDEVKDGRNIYALDKKLKKIVLVNNLTVNQLVELMNSASAETTRYEFWREEAEETDVPEATEVITKIKKLEEDEND